MFLLFFSRPFIACSYVKSLTEISSSTPQFHLDYELQMLCEERGLFLEIADIIRSFGLVILKGQMEFRENKIWTHFIVEVECYNNDMENIYRNQEKGFTYYFPEE